MSEAGGQYSVFKFYQSVIDEVVNGVRETFLDEKVDEKVLQALRSKWETKLIKTKAVDLSPDDHNAFKTNSEPSEFAEMSHKPENINPAVLPMNPNTMVSIHVTLPRLAVDPSNYQRQVTVTVPASCIQSNRLQTLLSLPTIQATLSLPTEVAKVQLQEQINRALSAGDTGVKRNTRIISQLDGNVDEDSSSDDSDLPNDDKEDEIHIALDESSEDDGKHGLSKNVQYEVPLNSDDDVSDTETPSDVQRGLENVVVCKYHKISRTRNKWKLQLKDGIMKLNGKDFVFQKATGDCDW